MKIQLRAVDTYDFGSSSFLVGEYDTVEKALKSKIRREKTRDVKKGNTFYKYFIVDSDGNKIYDS